MESTMRANREVFSYYKLKPRMMHASGDIDLSEIGKWLELLLLPREYALQCEEYKICKVLTRGSIVTEE
jgi:hypothetical protein